MISKKFINFDRRIILFSAVLFAALTVVLIVADTEKDWRYYQKEFRAMAGEYINAEKAAKIPQGIQQIWIEDLNRVDRCITCHQGILWSGFERAPQPYTTHPNLAMFESHPTAEYGCTICHGGQGYAIELSPAHGFIKHWEMPILAGVIAEDYNISDKNALVEINCNTCHRYERQTTDMPFINLAKDLIQEKACWGCHIINGSGGNIGPDLTIEGNKHAENFDWTNFTGFESVFNWHMQHFDEPASIVEGTVMPKMGLQTRDRQALSMLMMSWRDFDYPSKYIPGLKQTEELHPAEINKRDELLSGDGSFFIEKGCFSCHSISAFDIKSPTEKGPDLTFAVDDVRVRFKQTLQEFIFDPSQSGTMSIIFSEKVILTNEEKMSLIDILTKANHSYKQRQASVKD
jgi:cbb3-type cytochrome oxidase cytochrome c subunit